MEQAICGQLAGDQIDRAAHSAIAVYALSLPCRSGCDLPARIGTGAVEARDRNVPSPTLRR